MSRFGFRHDDDSSVATIATVLLGAIAGWNVGMFVAQRVGGFNGLKTRLTRSKNGSRPPVGLEQEYDETEEEESDFEYPASRMASSESMDEDFNGMDDDSEPLLEERVLEAFNNDPTLAERAIDIGAIGTGVIELAGWVDNDDEAERAMTLAQGVPGVDSVVNRLMVDDEEQEISETLRRAQTGDPALESHRWEGKQVGTGKRRQGTSKETDRHADPKPVLEDRWLSEREAVKNAAENVDEIAAERRKKGAANKKQRADINEPRAD